MFDRHTDVSDEDLGIRAFKVKRAKAVERAIERLRQGMGPSWRDLKEEEIEELEWFLGEMWSYVARAKWEELHFGSLGMSEVIKLLTFGSELRRHARPAIEILRDAEAMVIERGA